MRALSAAASRDEAIEIVRAAARELSGAHGICVVLREGDLSHYAAEDADFPLWAGQSFPMETCVSGMAMVSGEQIVIADTDVDPRVPHQLYGPTPVRSLVMTPASDRDARLALGAYWTSPGWPDEAQTEILGALAAALGAALRNLELLESLRGETRRQQLLVNELSHRVKNTLAIVQSLARQSFALGEDVGRARETFEARLQTLADAHGLLVDSGWRAIDLATLIEVTLAPFGDGRIDLRGPPLELGSKSAVTLALGLHELATNAVKHGALSVPAGRVEVDWGLVPAAPQTQTGPRLRLVWRESGGPNVAEPGRRGFGSRLLERGLAAELGGRATLAFRPEGLLFTLDAPAPDRPRPLADQGERVFPHLV